MKEIIQSDRNSWEFSPPRRPLRQTLFDRTVLQIVVKRALVRHTSRTSISAPTCLGGAHRNGFDRVNTTLAQQDHQP